MDKNEFKKKLGLKIKMKRLEAEISQESLANSANFSLPFISDIECGKKGISLYYFIKLANVLKFNLDEFFAEFSNLE